MGLLALSLALVGLLGFDRSLWPLYVIVTLVLALEWPFHIQLAAGVEIYLPVRWTGAAAAYAAGVMSLPIYYLSALLGFALIVLLDARGIVAATGLAKENVRRVRGQPFDPSSRVEGNLCHFVDISGNGLRAVLFTLMVPKLPLLLSILLCEAAVNVWGWLVPVPRRVASRYTRARFAAAMGGDLWLVAGLLHVVMVFFLLLCFESWGAFGLGAASLSTIILHTILKRLNDTRVESERRRLELIAMQAALDVRQRLATIGQTASSVFHQIARHHGAIGMFAHLLAAYPKAQVQEHARRILLSVEDANHVVEELLRFGQDRALNVYPHAVEELMDECVREAAPLAGRHGVDLEVVRNGPLVVSLDKNKMKQAIGNLLDNAIEATAAGERVVVAAHRAEAGIEITVRDYGIGIPPEIRTRLFTPFCTTKPDGVGLGLVLVKELIEAHGGAVQWKPAEPGTEFVLTLPSQSPCNEE